MRAFLKRLFPTFRYNQRVVVRDGFYNSLWANVEKCVFFGLIYKIDRDGGGLYFHAWQFGWNLRREAEEINREAPPTYGRLRASSLFGAAGEDEEDIGASRTVPLP